MSPVPFSLLIVSYASRRVPFLLPSVSCHRGSEEHGVPAVNGLLSARRVDLGDLGGAVCLGIFRYELMGQKEQG